MGQSQGGSSYGVITMTNAIAHCQNFYDPKSEWEKQVNTFKGIIDSLVKKAAEAPKGTKGSASSLIDKLLTEDALTAAAWAMRFDTVYYVKLRSIVPQTLGLRLYEKNVKAHLSSLPTKEITDNNNLMAGEPLVLTGADTAGLIVPASWHVDDNGIFFIKLDGGEEYVATEPMFVNTRLIDFDTRDRKLEIAFRDGDDGSYSFLKAPRADIRNKNKIVNYANNGLDVSSETAALVTRYLTAMENANKKALPFTLYISRAGWVEDNMIPLYTPKVKIIFNREDEDSPLDDMNEVGDFPLWLTMGIEVRKHPFARAILAASFASPLLAKLRQRNIYYHS